MSSTTALAPAPTRSKSPFARLTRTWREATPGERIFFIVAYVVLTSWAVVSLFPLYWMVLTALKPPSVVPKQDDTWLKNAPNGTKIPEDQLGATGYTRGQIEDLQDIARRNDVLLGQRARQVPRRLRRRHALHAQTLPHTFAKLAHEMRGRRAGAEADDHAVLDILERGLRRVEFGDISAHLRSSFFAAFAASFFSRFLSAQPSRFTCRPRATPSAPSGTSLVITLPVPV